MNNTCNIKYTGWKTNINLLRLSGPYAGPLPTLYYWSYFLVPAPCIYALGRPSINALARLLSFFVFLLSSVLNGISLELLKCELGIVLKYNKGKYDVLTSYT